MVELFIVAVVVAALILHRILPKTEMLADEGKVDTRSRILDALSAHAFRKIRPVDYSTNTSDIFTPRDLLSAFEFIEHELDAEIPRAVYWQDTIGEVVDSVSQFVETSVTAQFEELK